MAQWIGLTERRVRQLRDEGVIEEYKPGLYDLQPTVLRYKNAKATKSDKHSREKTLSRTAQMPERRFYCASQEANI